MHMNILSLVSLLHQWVYAPLNVAANGTSQSLTQIASDVARTSVVRKKPATTRLARGDRKASWGG